MHNPTDSPSHHTDLIECNAISLFIFYFFPRLSRPYISAHLLLGDDFPSVEQTNKRTKRSGVVAQYSVLAIFRLYKLNDSVVCFRKNQSGPMAWHFGICPLCMCVCVRMCVFGCLPVICSVDGSGGTSVSMEYKQHLFPVKSR